MQGNPGFGLRGNLRFVTFHSYFLTQHEQRRWCSGIMQDSHSCDPGSIPGRRTCILGFYSRFSPPWSLLTQLQDCNSEAVPAWPNG